MLLAYVLIFARASVTLPEPVKMRESGAAEQARLSEFQQELVQLGAVLNGDYTKDIYPHKLVEEMTVAEAARYLQDAFKTFLKECERCKKQGADDSYIVVVNPAAAAAAKKQSFVTKMLGCFACGEQSETGY